MTITLGVKRVERAIPEKRPARKLTQRVVVREAAWQLSSIHLGILKIAENQEEEDWVGTNLLRGEFVWAAKSKGEALALKDALDAAGEAEEEEGEEENQVWIFHFFSLLIF